MKQTLTLSATKEVLREKFFLLKNPFDLADLLEIELSRLNYHLYMVPESEKYKNFSVKKRNGDPRIISAPATSLKIIQSKLNQVLQSVYDAKRKPSVHGFTHDRSIRTNAECHVKNRYILNVDLKDFFPSINFGRVRGLFMGIPYKLNSTIATMLAQICCFENKLPQGAPTSPIIANMICAKMDSQLQILAGRSKCFYTRYADDITFSTQLRAFPTTLAIMSNDKKVEVGEGLKKIVAGNGFEINSSKVRLQHETERQEVTGLTVNISPNVQRKYIRQVRAMLHAWEKFKLEKAQTEYGSKFVKKHRKPGTPIPPFPQVVKGKIEFLGHVKGRQDKIYITLRERLRALDSNLVKEPPPSEIYKRFSFLKDELSFLFESKEFIREVLKEAEILTQDISFEGSATNMWSGILEEAEKHKKVINIVKVAMKKYPEREKLQIALDEEIKLMGTNSHS